MAKSKTSTKKASGAKKSSPYNKFMQDEIKRVKVAHPDLDHKGAFKKAAENWKNSPLNPKAATAKK